MKRSLKLGLAALALAGGPLAVVFAQGGGPAQTVVNYGKVFVQKLAATLGIDQAKLETAMKTAGTATVDEALKNQDITRSQADNLKNRIAQGDVPFLGRGGERGMDGRGFGSGGGRRGPGGMMGGPGMGMGMDMRALPDAAAKALGITTDELMTQLRSGKTLADIAASKNVDVKTVQAAILAAFKTQLDAAVKAGRITQARADELYKNAQADPNFGLRFGGRRFGR